MAKENIEKKQLEVESTGLNEKIKTVNDSTTVKPFPTLVSFGDGTGASCRIVDGEIHCN
ncbi:hypothetical protein [Fundicoccus ignavus]|uniref:Uncharacterized protein n=1 Tax=Fundicoccus ignavus TaxID=2664442 RepID=A0A844C2E3_9LACT|nr:hypothetical protein [Fundicoccus ignavus]MRJ47292.1 hypothetical protein [Fundicoccus ignavus]